MPDRRPAHQSSTRVLSAVMVLIGVALIVESIVQGSGIAIGRLVIGALFVAAGAGRIYVQGRGR